jgi:hypothetical protein
MSVEIRETPLGGSLRDFLNVVDYIYRDDPQYVRPLNMDIKETLSPKHPFFEHGEAAIFTAYRNGWCVGRCTAQIDHLHLERHGDEAGFFGFFDTIDDQEVCSELLEAASNWLSARGMKRVRGPYSLNCNGVVGCLVEGFETPPVFLNPHHRPYQGGLIESTGFSKIKDCYGWRYQVGDIPQRVRKALDDVNGMPEVSSRHADLHQVQRDIRVIMDVYNDGWSEHWGFVPLTEAELTALARELRLILIPELTLITEINGEPAAVALALPNINEMIGDLRGKLFPVGLAKLLWRLKIKGPKSGRLIILGIRKSYRNVRKYAALSLYLYAKMNEAGMATGCEWGELGWTLEDNHPVNTGIKMMGGKIYKRYRLYEREL